MENKYIIYKYTSPSGGVYIGQTSKSIKQRAQKCGKGYLTTNKETGEFLQPAIANAILKYGWDNFKKEILFDGLSSEEADQKEKELIKFYKNTGICYNITSGGKGILGVNKRKIKQYDLNGKFIREWDSITEAEEFLNKPRAEANISACCCGKRKRAYGYIWRYSDSDLEVCPLSPYRTSVDQFTKEGDYINTYPTIREASRVTGVHESGIGNCIKGRAKTAGGYVWKFH